MTFPISPLIRFSVQALYWALVLPLPLLLARQGTPLAQGALLAALLLGWGLLLGSLSQQIQVDAVGMRATYPAWVPPFVRQEWQIRWAEVETLNPAPLAKEVWCTTWSAAVGIASFCPCG
jgi:hypothetical protein